MRKPIPGHPFYEATDSGEIFRVGSLTPKATVISNTGGYLQVSIWEYGKGKTHFVHQLIAIAFHGPRPSPRHHAAHRDGDKMNNTPANVQWITKEENEADKVAHGRSNRGERNGHAKLSDAQAREVIERAAHLPRSSGGKRIKKGAIPAMAKEYGVTASCLHQIILGYRRLP